MTNLSPGPWRVEDHEHFTAILDRDGKKIAEVYCRDPGRGGSLAQRWANARAMAKVGETR